MYGNIYSLLNNVNNVKKPMTRSCEVNSLEERHMVMTVTENKKDDLGNGGGETSGVKVMCSQRTRSTKMEPPIRDVPSTAPSPQADSCHYCKLPGHQKTCCPKLKKRMKSRRNDNTTEPISPSHK